MENKSTSSEENRITGKIIRITLLALALMACGLLAVYILTDKRESLNQTATREIQQQWGARELNIRNIQLRLYKDDRLTTIEPGTTEARITIETQQRHKGIYDAQVSQARVQLSGTFCPGPVRPDSLTIAIEISDAGMESGMRLIEDRYITFSPLQVEGREYPWKRGDLETAPAADKSTPDITIGTWDEETETWWVAAETASERQGLFTVCLDDLPPADTLRFAAEFTVKVGGKIAIRPMGRHSILTMTGNNGSPSFKSCSPDTLEIQKSRFTARWEFTDYDSRHYYNSDSRNICSVEFVSISGYRKTMRAINYAFIIILLTFACVFFTEINLRKEIPLLNYLLIGAALILFYLLLLSFSEQLPFGLAYLIAAGMTTSLITAYMWKMLHSPKVALTTGALLLLMYGICYIMFSITAALLAGSLLIYAVLAVLMYGSLKIKY